MSGAERGTGAARVLGDAEARAWRRVQAGMLVELNLADRKEMRRWQEAVLRGEFDPDACARDLIGAEPNPAAEARLLERSARLERDFLMAPLQSGVRGAGRKARGAARGVVAFFVSQILAIVVYTLIIVVILLLLRMQKGTSVDGMLDRTLEVLTPGSDESPAVPATTGPAESEEAGG